MSGGAASTYCSDATAERGESNGTAWLRKLNSLNLSPPTLSAANCGASLSIMLPSLNSPWESVRLFR
jgi:hypothetical protein